MSAVRFRTTCEKGHVVEIKPIRVEGWSSFMFGSNRNFCDHGAPGSRCEAWVVLFEYHTIKGKWREWPALVKGSL